MKYKAIIFDFFGVISSEVEPFWSKKHLTEKDVIELKSKYLIPVDTGKISEEEFFVALGRLSSISPEEIRRDWLDLAIINKSVVELIRALAENHKLAILSDAPALFIREIVTKNKLENLFDKIIVSSEVGLTKRDKAIFELALKELDVASNETVFVDDRSENIARAKSLGMEGFVFTDEAKLKKDLSNIGVI